MGATLTKRAAISTIFFGVLSKMAGADEPLMPISGPNGNAVVALWNGPMIWTISLDQIKQFDVTLGGKTVTIAPEEIFAALSA